MNKAKLSEVSTTGIKVENIKEWDEWCELVKCVETTIEANL